MVSHSLTGRLHWHLVGVDFLAGLSRADRELFYGQAARRELRRGAVVFSEGDRALACHYIEKGVIQAHRFTADGKCPILFLRGPGDIFGLAELVNREPRNFSTRAMTPCLLYEVPESGFEALLGSPAITRRMMAVLGRRVRYLHAQVQDFMSLGVAERLLKLFVSLSYNELHAAMPGNEPVPLPFRLTQEEMAAMIGSCQQTVSTSLKAMQNEGLIALSGRRVVLRDPRAALEFFGL